MIVFVNPSELQIYEERGHRVVKTTKHLYIHSLLGERNSGIVNPEFPNNIIKELIKLGKEDKEDIYTDCMMPKVLHTLKDNNVEYTYV